MLNAYKKFNDEELNKISMNASKEIGMGGLEIAYFPENGYDTNKYFHVDHNISLRIINSNIYKKV